MKRFTTFLTASAVLLFLSALPVSAQHGGGGGGAGMGHGGGMGQGSSMGGGSSTSHGNDMGSRGGNTSMGKGESSTGASSSSPTRLLSSNTKLASSLQTRLGSLLPSGMTLTEAASGFRNLGQFIAAVHVSHNLDIPFSDLKSKMTSGDSLGKAIHALKPDANAKAETKKANAETKDDLKQSNETES